MKRKQHSIRKVDEMEADFFNKMFEELYQHKVEETVHKNSAGSFELKTYREVESGIFFQASACGTSYAETVAFDKTYNSVLNVELTPVGTAVDFYVTDITACQMTVKIIAEATTDPVKLYYKITGSLE